MASFMNAVSSDPCAHPREVWRTLRDKLPKLSEIAVRLFSMPVSPASAERNFREHGSIHTKARNRLSSDKQRKLVRITSYSRKVIPHQSKTYDVIAHYASKCIGMDRDRDQDARREFEDRKNGFNRL
eukprot:ANDGO_02688.mRNA.1 hypothetical protein PHYSODRAFT_254830